MLKTALKLLQTGSFINGHWLGSAASGESYAVYNPASGELLAEQPCCGKKEAEQALEAAVAALVSWRDTLASERAEFLLRWYELVKKNRSDLAQLICYEQGKPLFEAEKEVDYGAGFLSWFAQIIEHDYGEIIPPFRKGNRIFSIKEALGVAALITPWNFPLAMLTRKIAPALAAGCTVIAKPSEETPLSANALMLLAQEAELPVGVVNMVSGHADEISQVWLTDQRVRKFSFTGSTAVGKKLFARCTSTVKKVSLELGGNAPFLVFADARREVALQAVLTAKFRNSGQSCIGLNRLYIESSIYEEFVEQLVAHLEKLQVKAGWLDDCDVGPMINRQAIVKITKLIDDLKNQENAHLRYQQQGELFEDSLFFPPTLLEVPAGSKALRASHEEVEFFSPVLVCQPFENEDEAVQLANDSHFGLVAYCATDDQSRSWRLSSALESGMVVFNSGVLSAANVPFGGIKESGLGKEGGSQGLAEYQKIKYVLMDGLE